MYTNSSLKNVKLILDIEADDSSFDEIIGVLLQKSEAWIRGICGIYDNETLCGELINLTEDLCIASYNRIGSEGFTAEMIGSIRIDYADLYSNFKNILCRHKRIKF